MPTERGRRPKRIALAAVLVLSGGSDLALAQARAWSFEPRLNLTETFSDNIVTGSRNAQSDSVTRITPGFRLSSQGARARLSADYSLNELIYARDSSRNQRQNSLNAFGAVEAIENWLFVDFSWLISQQTISAFATQSTSNVNVDANRTETSSVRIAPYIRGRLGSVASYDINYSLNKTNAKSAQATDSETEQWGARLSGATGLAKLGWALSYSGSSNQVSRGRNTRDNRGNVELNYRFDPEWLVAVRAGRESQDLDSSTNRTGSTSGLSLDWTPGPRTALQISADQRGYGNTHQISFNHRTPLSAWRFSDARTATLLPTQFTRGSVGTVYDLMYAQLESTFPDPLVRAQQVNDLLLQTGISPNAQVTSGFLAARMSMQRRQELSLVLMGKRNTVTYTLLRSEQDALGTAPGATDDFVTNSKVIQRGFTSNWAYRLTAITSLGLVSSRLATAGDGAGTQQRKQNQLTLNVTTKLGPKTSGSLAATHSNTTGQQGQNDSDENSMVGTVSMQF